MAAGLFKTLAILVASPCAAALCIPTQAFAQPSDEPARAAVPEPPAPPDIIVRGRGYAELRLEIKLAEEAVFARWNDINSTDDFDIQCRVEQQTGSLIDRRVCMSNSWLEQDANIGQAVVRFIRGEYGPPAAPFRGEQLMMQRRLNDEMQRLSLEDDELREEILRLGRARLALAANSGAQGKWTAWRQVPTGIDGLPYEAERAFEVRIGQQPWTHLLERRTFTIAHVTGRIRSVTIDCVEDDETFEYEPDAEWTLPPDWSSCILGVRAKKDTTFALFEF